MVGTKNNSDRQCTRKGAVAGGGDTGAEGGGEAQACDGEDRLVVAEDQACDGEAPLVVAEDEAGQRLDRFLAAKLQAFSRTRLQALIKSGHVMQTSIAPHPTPAGGPTGDGVVAEQPARDPGKRVRHGDCFVVDLPPLEIAEPKPEKMNLAIIFEDDHVIVIDKPRGLVVHPAPGHASGTLVNGLLDHCGKSLSGINGVRRPGIVHRLDKDTSGLLVVAKSDGAHQGLSEQFQAHGRDGRLSRRYLALVWGVPARPKGIIDAPIGRSLANRLRMAVMSEGQMRAGRGRQAVTRYKVLQAFVDDADKPLAALLECELETGRTHQIRVHLAHQRHPLLGDTTYGAGFAASASRLSSAQLAALQHLDRQALHAVHLGFEHPVTGEKLGFDSDVPSDLRALIDAFRRQSKTNS